MLCICAFDSQRYAAKFVFLVRLRQVQQIKFVCFPSDCLSVAEKMRAATKQKTDQWGFVRNVCGSPRFDSAGTAAEGQAFGVLMEVARTEYLLSISQQQ